MQLGHLVQTVNTECALAIIRSEQTGESLFNHLLASWLHHVHGELTV